jgi:RHS repeat-associated protein
MVYDPTASVPAVLLAKNYASSSTTYMYNVREPDGWLLCSFDAAETPNKYYCHFDGLGSTVLVTNGSGSISDSFTYGAWGDVLNFPANNQKPYRYVGRLGYYAHTSTQGTALADLMQLGVRFYDDGIGRFTQRNPLLMASSLYLYVGARSTSAVDPSGYKYEAIYGDGRICVDSSCSGQSYFPGGIQNAPNYGGPSQRLPNPPCPSKGKTRQNCALTDGIVVPPGTSFDVDGFPQRSKTPPTNFLKIAGGWTCTFTCNSAATGNNIKLSCKITSKIPGPGLSPPKWENNPNF